TDPTRPPQRVPSSRMPPRAGKETPGRPRRHESTSSKSPSPAQQQALDRDVLAEILPRDPPAPSYQAPVATLVGAGEREAREPDQRNGQRAPVGERDLQAALG